MPGRKNESKGDYVAHRLAAVTAGAILEAGAGGRGPSSALDVLAALGMSSAGQWGGMLLLASYTHDEHAWDYCLQRAIRWAWLAWLATADERTKVTTGQVGRLADLALQHHCNPALARRTSLETRASLVRIGRDRYIRDFHPQYSRLCGEMEYQETSAVRALLRRLR